jgi:hypothetical protein
VKEGTNDLIHVREILNNHLLQFLPVQSMEAFVQESAQGNSHRACIQHLPLCQRCGGKASLHKKRISVLMTDLHATCPVGFLTVLFVRSFVFYIVLKTFLGVYVLYGKE